MLRACLSTEAKSLAFLNTHIWFFHICQNHYILYFVDIFLTGCLQVVHGLFTKLDYTQVAVSDGEGHLRRQQCFFITILLTPARCHSRASLFSPPARWCRRRSGAPVKRIRNLPAITVAGRSFFVRLTFTFWERESPAGGFFVRFFLAFSCLRRINRLSATK